MVFQPATGSNLDMNLFWHFGFRSSFCFFATGFHILPLKLPLSVKLLSALDWSRFSPLGSIPLRRALRLTDALNKVPGISCQPIDGVVGVCNQGSECEVVVNCKWPGPKIGPIAMLYHHPPINTTIWRLLAITPLFSGQTKMAALPCFEGWKDSFGRMMMMMIECIALDRKALMQSCCLFASTYIWFRGPEVGGSSTFQQNGQLGQMLWEG